MKYSNLAWPYWNSLCDQLVNEILVECGCKKLPAPLVNDAEALYETL